MWFWAIIIGGIVGTLLGLALESLDRSMTRDGFVYIPELDVWFRDDRRADVDWHGDRR